MADLLAIAEYREDLKMAAQSPLPWELLAGKTVVISGATGLLGRFLIDVLMQKNAAENLGCSVIALGRSTFKAKQTFAAHWPDPLFSFVECQINSGEIPLECESAEYIIHLASNTHPVAYATDPIGTITTNVIGTNHLLRLAVQKKTRRFLFASSVEVYGENRGDCEVFDEAYCGYIDCNTLRAGYPESKRTGEALCQAYIKQENLDVVIARLARSYGPTMLDTDTKALSQFLKNGIANEDIVLKSAGTQLYSYTYMADAVTGLLYCLLFGEEGEAYNIADASSAITLKELAETIARASGTKVIFELPNAVESTGFSKATKAVLDGAKIGQLGWRPAYTIPEGIGNTLRILKKVHKNKKENR